MSKPELATGRVWKCRPQEKSILSVPVSARIDAPAEHSLAYLNLQFGKSHVLCFSHTHTHRAFITMWPQALRTMYMFSLASKWVSFFSRAFIFIIGT